MGTKVIIKPSKLSKTKEPKDYPRLMIGDAHGKQIFFMTSPAKGICLTNHQESYYGIQTLEELKDFNGSLTLINEH